ncbi:MAG TPA: indolepyruvate ferredoxin oxidoreductase subunit beta, partial [Firmicutes bacterium]|nr:indolepyruvate ferredoxin oxidoreductase subunit beta [Bacillota bacterium]
DAGAIALEAGGLKFTNTVMLGAAAATRIIDLPRTSLLQAIEQLVPGKYLEANIKAFEMGAQLS